MDNNNIYTNNGPVTEPAANARDLNTFKDTNIL